MLWTEPLETLVAPTGPFWVPVKDESERVMVKRLYLHQLGTSAIKVGFRSAARKVNVVADTVVINVACTRDFMTPESWGQAKTCPIPL